MNNFKRIELGLLFSNAFTILIYVYFGLDIIRWIYTILAFILALFYFGFSKYIFANSSRISVWYSICIGIIYSIAIMGICFWINDFNGYNPLLLISSLFLLLLFLPMSFFIKPVEFRFYNSHRLRSVLFGVSTLMIYLFDFI